MITKMIEKIIGLDIGIKFFLTDSDGRQIENPKFYKKTLERNSTAKTITNEERLQ